MKLIKLNKWLKLSKNLKCSINNWRNVLEVSLKLLWGLDESYKNNILGTVYNKNNGTNTIIIQAQIKQIYKTVKTA